MIELNKIPYRRTGRGIRGKLDGIKLRHHPRTLNERLGISPVTVRRLAAESETRLADERRNRTFSPAF